MEKERRKTEQFDKRCSTITMHREEEKSLEQTDKKIIDPFAAPQAFNHLSEDRSAISLCRLERGKNPDFIKACTKT